MAGMPTKAAGSVYCKARLEAAKHDGRLNSREKAAEMIGYDPSTVAGWELGSKRPSPEAVLLMADTYNAPGLCNHFCTSECPLGKDMPALIDGNLDRLTLRALGAIKKMKAAEAVLIDITSDGVIDNEKMQHLEELLSAFDEMSTVHNSLKVWYQKYNKE